jgi:hypothetical protein
MGVWVVSVEVFDDVKPAAVDVKMDVSRIKVRRDGFPDLHILVSSPSTKNWNFKKHNCINQYAKQHSLSYLDMNLSVEEMDINWNEDSKDGGDHLNLKGAQKATTFLGSWLKNKLELPDHRAEESYQPWNTQLEKYHKLIEQNNAKGNLSLTQSAKTIANQVLKSSGFSQAQESISP